MYIEASEEQRMSKPVQCTSSKLLLCPPLPLVMAFSVHWEAQKFHSTLRQTQGQHRVLLGGSTSCFHLPGQLLGPGDIELTESDPTCNKRYYKTTLIAVWVKLSLSIASYM